MRRWLHRVPLTVLAIMMVCAPVVGQQTATPAAAAPAADSADVTSPEALVTVLYDVISGPAGEARDRQPHPARAPGPTPVAES